MNVITAGVVIFFIWILGIQRTSCLDVDCLYLKSYGFYEPLIILCKSLLVSVLALIIVPSQYFKHWLMYFASWAIPVSLLIIFSESPYNTGGVLGLAGRNFNATVMGYLLVFGTVLFILAKAIYVWIKRRTASINKGM